MGISFYKKWFKEITDLHWADIISNGVYNIFLYCYFIITCPFYFVKFFKYRVSLMERLGSIKRLPVGQRILVHTVSVGEFLGALPFINALRNKYPNYQVIISTTTVTGNRIAKTKVGTSYRIVYFPLDFLFSVKRFFDRISPDLVILVETELWPNFLTIARQKDIPILVINGRISEHSYRNYSMLKGFFRNICEGVKTWGVQFKSDMDRLINLGISKDRIFITGSMKFDSAIQIIPDLSMDGKEGALVLAGGSTHHGEENILLDIYKEIKDNFKNLVLILAPRHPERTEAIEKIIKGYGLRYVLKSKLGNDAKFFNYEVILVDTLGELVSLYSLADVVFIGKSLVKGGGQNLLEPAALGKSVICGPMMWNFQDIINWMVSNGGVVQVGDKQELKQAIVHLLNNTVERARLGNRAKELVLEGCGAVKRNMKLVDMVMKNTKILTIFFFVFFVFFLCLRGKVFSYYL